MRLLTQEEIQQLFFYRKCGGLTESGEQLYQRVIRGDLSYDFGGRDK